MAEWSTLARPYAKAAFDYAVEHNALDRWSQQLAQVATVTGADKIARLISSSVVPVEQQAATLIEVLGDAIDEPCRNLIRVLAENRRLPLLPLISALFDQMKANREQSVDVEVISAFPLDSALSERLAEALRTKLERDVTIHTEVDKSLLGGVVIRAGDVVIDGSVRGRLAKLASAMNS
ncbi:MAG: F0F1 ATP synthase subunit delta [Spongiibacteraceae bacterium]|jgi:F-type H+-transporting ATPase subunit delta|nr:F0F1 ATP synthase subunit delta [Spongiibacteraceae bacterium]